MSKLLPTDSILVYQHNTTRMYRALRYSTEVFTAPHDITIQSYASPALAVKRLSSNSYILLTPSWLLVDTLTSDIYPELFL